MKRTQMCNLESHGFYFDLMGFKIQLRIRLGLLILQVVFQSSPNRLEPASGMCVVVSQLFVMKKKKPKNKKPSKQQLKGKKKRLKDGDTVPSTDLDMCSIPNRLQLQSTPGQVQN